MMKTNDTFGKKKRQRPYRATQIAGAAATDTYTLNGVIYLFFRFKG